MSLRPSHRLRTVVLSIVAAAAGIGCTMISGVGKFEVVETTPGVDGSPDGPSSPTTTDEPDAPSSTNEDDASTDADDGNPDTGGKPKKRVFVTNAMWQGGALGGAAGADKLCNDAASAAGLGAATWRAWLSTTSESAVQRLDPHGPWVLLNNGGEVANNVAELSSGTLRKAINITETGTTTPNDQDAVWTGTGANGAANSSSPSDLCSNWTSGYLYGHVGSSVSDKAQWTSKATILCVGSARLYCFEQ